MDVLKLIKEKETLLKRSKEIDEIFENNPDALKDLFIGKCFIFNEGYDVTIYAYNVTSVLTDCGRPKYLQDFEFEHGYCIFEREEEITDHLSDFTYEIKSVNTARFMKTPNLYDLYKSMREVSKEEFFNELEKETHINYIRDFPKFNNYVTFYDSRKNGFINLNNY